MLVRTLFTIDFISGKPFKVGVQAGWCQRFTLPLMSEIGSKSQAIGILVMQGAVLGTRGKQQYIA